MRNNTLRYQFYAPAWWKLWPHYSASDELVAGTRIIIHVVCVGPFQWYWYTMK